MRTRGPDIKNRTVVGIRSPGIGDGDGPDSDGSANTSRRGAVCVGVIITSGDDGGDTGVDEVDDGVIDGRRSVTC